MSDAPSSTNIDTGGSSIITGGMSGSAANFAGRDQKLCVTAPGIPLWVNVPYC